MQTMCSICHQSLEESPSPSSIYGGRIGTLPCGHIFHVACVNTWWNTTNRQALVLHREYSCPSCRQTSTMPYVFQVYLSAAPVDDTCEEHSAQIRELQGVIQQQQEALALLMQRLNKNSPEAANLDTKN